MLVLRSLHTLSCEWALNISIRRQAYPSSLSVLAVCVLDVSSAFTTAPALHALENSLIRFRGSHEGRRVLHLPTSNDCHTHDQSFVYIITGQNNSISNNDGTSIAYVHYCRTSVKHTPSAKQTFPIYGDMMALSPAPVFSCLEIQDYREGC